MGSNGTSHDRSAAEQVAAIEAAIRELAYAAWADYRRDQEQDTSQILFERVYLGHYSAVDFYVIQLVDAYDLDAKLDQAIAEPFRRHVDIDITAFSQALVANEAIYSLQAAPVGVWVFNGDIG
ncbi:MAG: hypothetical protein JO144_14030 [Actinobacteria bacterium]|nr:hypothetical protein [Actinomycetota bacterium]